jgi:ketosteroid isomerase-like protein
MNTNLTLEQQGMIEAQCVRIIAAYAYNVDRRNYEALADLFTEDGVLDRGGHVTEGRSAILAAMFERPAHIATRHMNGIPHFLSVTEDEAVAVTYMLMYVVEGTDEGPNNVPGTTGLGEFHDTFRRTSEGWKLAERRARPAMIVKR